ncbi:MAG: hypothetical protein IGS50_03735 [Synechococcales cyanobacterium C42_A2020_086]|nr:hypothetical protein [Synechococcales cyanobacterium C42_A2020_086]
MKSVIAAVMTAAATAALALGISQVINRQLSAASLNRRSTPNSQAEIVGQATGQATTQAARQPADLHPSPAPTATVVRFEQLPLCDQLDGIAKAGKSVAQFIADSGRYSEFAVQVQANCNWHAEQLQTANAILHPPVVEVPVRTVVRRDPVVVPAPKPPTAWNNCNGIQEPGETYSLACHNSQLANDMIPGHQDPLDLDQRQPDAWGNKPPANGYSLPAEPHGTPELTDPSTDPLAEAPY